MPAPYRRVYETTLAGPGESDPNPVVSYFLMDINASEERALVRWSDVGKVDERVMGWCAF